MSEEWMKAAVWGLVTLAMLIVLWLSWRSYRADQAKLQKLQDFRERYDVEMTQLYRWFASDECALMVLDWLDRQLVGGERRPDGSRRLEVASHGLQAVRQAVRDSHFNDRCRGAADASCAMSVVAASSQPRVTPEQMADLRNACWEGLDIDVFMALCINVLLQGRTVKVITERREYLNPQPAMVPFDRFSEPVLRRIVNDLGEQVWPNPEDAFATEQAQDGGRWPRYVEVIYEVVKPTVDEKVDEVLRLVRAMDGARVQTNVVHTGCTSMAHAAKIAEHYASQPDGALKDNVEHWTAERVPVETMEPLKRPVPSGWAVKRQAAMPRDLDDYLGPLDGWLQDPRRAVLFGNKEAAIAAQAALSVGSKLAISVVWLVYDPVFDTYREQAQ